MKKLLILILIIIILLNIVNCNDIEKITNKTDNLYNMSYNTVFYCKNIYNELDKQLNERFNSRNLDAKLEELESLDKELESKCKSLETLKNGCLKEQTINIPKIDSPYEESNNNK